MTILVIKAVKLHVLCVIITYTLYNAVFLIQTSLSVFVSFIQYILSLVTSLGTPVDLHSLQIQVKHFY